MSIVRDDCTSVTFRSREKVIIDIIAEVSVGLEEGVYHIVLVPAAEIELYAFDLGREVDICGPVYVADQGAFDRASPERRVEAARVLVPVDEPGVATISSLIVGLDPDRGMGALPSTRWTWT